MAMRMSNEVAAESAAADDVGVTKVLLAALGALDGTTIDRLRAGADNADAEAVATLGALLSKVRTYGFNGTTWDRWRNNEEVTPFASAARTATANSSDTTNYNARGVRLHLDITAVSGTTPTLDIKLQAKVNGVYIDIAGAAFAQKTATGTDELVVYPGIAETANESVSDVIPRVWRAVATIAGTTPSFTFSLGASYIS